MPQKMHTFSHILSTDEPIPIHTVSSSASSSLRNTLVLILNAQSINPSAYSSTRWKLKDIKALILHEQAKNHSLPFLCFTETWLKSYILDAQIHLPGYDIRRSDRSKRLGGGVLLYSHINLPISFTAQHDDSICQALFCKFDTIKKCVAVVYRPPDAKHESFVKVIQFLQEQIVSVNDDSFTICITGDFNFSRINWENGLISPGGSSDDTSLPNFSSNSWQITFMDSMFFAPHVNKTLWICSSPTITDL